MGSLVISGIMWYGSTLDETLNTIIFWVFFILSSFALFRLYGFIRDFFITIFAKCHEVDQGYIDEKIRKHTENLNADS